VEDELWRVSKSLGSRLKKATSAAAIKADITKKTSTPMMLKNITECFKPISKNNVL
jgi:hypothetical protein